MRKLQVGMTEAEVRQLMGPPASVSHTGGGPGPEILFDSTWDYDHRPARSWLGVGFLHGRMTLAYAIRRRWLAGDQTLFEISPTRRYESKPFTKDFCAGR
jgi:hypothetical protein